MPTHSTEIGPKFFYFCHIQEYFWYILLLFSGNSKFNIESFLFLHHFRSLLSKSPLSALRSSLTAHIQVSSPPHRGITPHATTQPCRVLHLGNGLTFMPVLCTGVIFSFSFLAILCPIDSNTPIVRPLPQHPREDEEDSVCGVVQGSNHRVLRWGQGGHGYHGWDGMCKMES